MARIAFVQSYPYDADLGGDAAYIQAFAQHLKRQGHEIHGFVTDVARDRTNPLYRSAYPIDQFDSWQVRRSIRLGPKRFLGHPTTLLRKLSRLPRSCPEIESWAPREAAWLDKALARLRPDATVLVHGAIYLAPHLSKIGARFALLGHIPFRRNQIDASGRVHEDQLASRHDAFTAALKCVDGIGLNSRDDIAYAAKYLADGDLSFVGMGYRDVPTSPASDKPLVLFVGNATVPNRSALTWFLDRVWPSVVAAHPAARFRVVGQVALTGEARSFPSVDYIGPVQDLAAEYQGAQVVVAPLVLGTSGVKIKVAEAISYGRPIVTTSIGIDSLDRHQIDDAGIVADQPADFALGVIKLLSDSAFRTAKSAGARQVFQKHFSSSACYGDFTMWLELKGLSSPSAIVDPTLPEPALLVAANA